MDYYKINIPPYPFFLFSGDALYRPGDRHRKRSSVGCFDLLFVEYGSLYMRENGVDYHIKQNDALILHPQRTHRAYKGCDEKTYFHWLHFYTTENFETSNSFRHQLPPAQKFPYNKVQAGNLTLPVYQSIDVSKAPSMLKILNSLETLSINRYQKSELVDKPHTNNSHGLYQQELFMSLLLYLAVDKDATDKNQIAQIIMQYLRSNYAQSISLEDLAKAANCHPTHVIRCFSKEYSTTPMKQLSSIRVEQAKTMLENTSLSCEEIAERVGFSSPAYFSSIFKKYLGVSPQAYRNET